MTEHDDLPRFRELGTPEQQRLVRAADEDAPPAGLEAAIFGTIAGDASSTGVTSEQRGAHAAATKHARTSEPDAARDPYLPARSRTSDRKMQRNAHIYAPVALVAAAASALLYFFTRPAWPPTELSREITPSVSAATTRPAPGPRRAPIAGAPCAHTVKATGSATLIDDFEDKNSRLLPSEGRTGYWYTFNDGSGKEQPPTGPMSPSSLHPRRGSSVSAIHAVGDRLSDWGASVGFTFGENLCYDASAYAGLEFWARGQGSVLVSVKMFHTIPKGEGGDCEHYCYDGHVTRLALEREFKKYTVLWSELKQRGYGDALIFDPAALAAVDFAVGPEDTPYDFWIDDIAFVKKAAAAPQNR